MSNGSPHPLRSSPLSRLTVSVLAASQLIACGGAPAPAGPTTPAPVAVTPSPLPVAQRSLAEVGLDAAALDKTVDPCTDFYGFACGGWIANTQIPADKSRWVRSFSVIHEQNEKELRKILEAAAADASAGPVKQRLGTYYKSCMDEAAIDSVGTKPLLKLQALVRKVRDQKTLDAAITELHRQRIWAVFDISAQQDFDDASKMIAFMDQNGLGLPDRDYYVLDDDEPAQKVAGKAGAAKGAAKPAPAAGKPAPGQSAGKPAPDGAHASAATDVPDQAVADKAAAEQAAALAKKKQILVDYEAHVTRLLMLGGMRPAEAKRAAKDVLLIETALAKVSKTKVERRDPKKLYNKVDRAGVEQAVPQFDWSSYFAALGAPQLKDISVTSPAFFAGVNELLSKFKPAQWQSYLQWQLLHAMAPSLSERFVAEAFTLTKLLTGQEQIEDRWKRCVASTDDAMGEALAQPFVEAHFAGNSKAAAEGYVHAIAAAFKATLAQLDWMDATTRQRAQAKLKAMAYLIGYPNKWKDYDFPVGDAYAANVLDAEAWKLRDDLSQIGEPVDREKWEMSPPTVNAYYHPSKNHMVFPAGILQPPFYSVHAGVAVNLGAMGMVVGHELTHGFDDEGSQFDKDGNLRDWWEPPVQQTFKGKTACVSKQYSGYEVLPGIKINGQLTLGENIADMGGLKLAFAAYRALRKDRQEQIVADGYTEDQQFFISNGQIWCAKYREEAARSQVINDPHSAPRFRVNGPLSNLPEFARAFECKAGAPMNPEQRCSVW